MKVCVQGLWHLGSVTAACIASLGNKVVGLDFDKNIIQELAKGNAPIFEQGLNDLIQLGLINNNLKFTDQIIDAVSDIDVLWITYDTPVDEEDVANVEFVISQIEMTLPHLPVGTTVLVSSQMPVGSVRCLEAIASKNYPDKQLGFACMPENLRLGKSIDIFLHPDRIVVGVRKDRDRMIIHNLLSPITSRIEWMRVESAEMTKHAINAFLAISVTFANELASICESVGADAKEVERGLKSEIRIGPKAYLSPGAAFAGGTLARDISYLTKISKGFKLKSLLLNAVKFSNDEHKNWTKRKIEVCCSNLAECSITIWGLTYKPGTNTLRRSMAVELCEWLITQGASINVHDPVVKDLPESWSGKVNVFDNEVEALKGAQILVLSTEWPIYKEIDPDRMAQVTNNLIIIDANHFLSQIAKDSRFRYFTVGVPA